MPEHQDLPTALRPFWVTCSCGSDDYLHSDINIVGPRYCRQRCYNYWNNIGVAGLHHYVIGCQECAAVWLTSTYLLASKLSDEMLDMNIRKLETMMFCVQASIPIRSCRINIEILDSVGPFLDQPESS